MPRYSTDEDDGGFFFYSQARSENKNMRTFLFGEELAEVELADEERGYVVCAMTNIDGRLFQNDEEEIVRVKLHGRVTVLLVEDDRVKISPLEFTKEEKALIWPDEGKRYITDKNGVQWTGDGKVVVHKSSYM